MKQAPPVKLTFWSVVSFIATIQLIMRFIPVSLLEQTGDVRSKAVIGRNQDLSKALYQIQVI